MQSVTRIATCVFLLSSALVSAYQNNPKLRRDGVVNLYPFPRVGRASHRTWQVPVSDFYLDDYEPVEKRQLYAFPRVGRGDTSLLREAMMFGKPQAMPLRQTEGPGMWFGPRLGRSVKGEDDDMVMQNENSERSQPEQIEDHLERKKRHTLM